MWYVYICFLNTIYLCNKTFLFRLYMSTLILNVKYTFPCFNLTIKNIVFQNWKWTSFKKSTPCHLKLCNISFHHFICALTFHYTMCTLSHNLSFDLKSKWLNEQCIEKNSDKSCNIVSFLVYIWREEKFIKIYYFNLNNVA